METKRWVEFKNSLQSQRPKNGPSFTLTRELRNVRKSVFPTLQSVKQIYWQDLNTFWDRKHVISLSHIRDSYFLWLTAPYANHLEGRFSHILPYNSWDVWFSRFRMGPDNLHFWQVILLKLLVQGILPWEQWSSGILIISRINIAIHNL